MLSLLSEIRFWSTQDDIQLKSTDYSCYKYHAGRDGGNQLFSNCQRKYVEARGFMYTVTSKRPEKLKERLKEFEDALATNKIICASCIDHAVVLLLSRGLVVHVKVDKSDISGIHIDRTLSARVQPDVVTDGAICSAQQVVCVCKDGRIIGQGGAWKEWVIESGQRRNVTVQGELLAIWGRTGSEHPQPWTPVTKDHQRANLHLYWIGARGPDLLSYRKTDGEPIKVAISKINHRCIIVVEQKVSQRGSVSVEVCLFELVGNALKRTSITAVPLQTQISCSALSENETYLTLCCIDGSLAVLDRNRGSSRIIKASFIPKHVAWHSSGALFTISNEKGQIQYYDVALNSVNIQLANEETTNPVFDVSCYFNAQKNVEMLFWSSTYLFVAMEQGPLLVFSHIPNALSFQSLCRMYIREQKLERAIRLLLSWDFNEQAFAALQMIVAQIMKSPLKENTAKLLQDALGSFHCPSVPLSAEIHHKFGAQVKSLTRKFFHQLVRSKMYETSFLLAVDLGHHDLFMDLHYVAVKIGETEMAAAARAQASALVSRCSSQASNCSRSICSQCSASSVSSGESSKDEYGINHASDNYLSTNFNNPIPKTYKPVYTPPIPSIDLPKIKLFNKSPMAPPLPSTPSLPISSINNIGIPLSLPHDNRFIPIRTMPRIPPPHFKPLPPLMEPIFNPAHISSSTATTIPNQGKKPQAKVKFSDTVTAFIVPEVKRPIRVPPPAHVTDPQKELADSLPLCHPNEDYLKDFTPISREANESPPVVQQPKIKVVHFGVV